MRSQAWFVNWLCRFYRVTLYAYPRQFRREYGSEMRQVFHDQCRDLKAGQALWFALRSVSDWATTAVREGAASLRDGYQARRRKEQLRGFAAEWLVTAIVYLFAATTLVQAYVVPTGSMEGNLRVGDHMLVDRMTYADPGAFGRYLLPYRDVRRGDIVAFLYPEDVSQTYVKRVIGLPGDRIRLVDKQVIRNGRALVEPYTQHIFPAPDVYRDNFPQPSSGLTTARGLDMLRHHVRDGEVIVPLDALFVMGDNRDNSADSRYWGFVPRSYVVGKPLLVYWSFDAPTDELEAWTFAHALDVAEHFFTKTRWERTLLIPRAREAQ